MNGPMWRTSGPDYAVSGSSPSGEVDKQSTQQYSCVSDSRFDSSGKLPPEIHSAAWNQIVARLGFTARRKHLLKGLREALGLLKFARCRLVYLDGSFVTSKPEPADFDACWGVEGVDVDHLDPVFLDFSDFRARQKQRVPEGATGKTFLEFFQIDKETGNAKGILAIDLRRWKS